MTPTTVTLNPISYCSLPIRLINYDSGAEISTATGFWYKIDKTYYLITNWHNVTGVNPITKDRMSEYAASPTGIMIPVIKQTRPYLQWAEIKYALYDKKEKPKWLLHPVHKEKVDVVVMKIGENDAGYTMKAVNEIEFDNFKPEVSDDVFILGFPHGLSGGSKFPLWKRGSIASEPDIDMDKLPKMLVDTASRPGMSGAPVIFKRQGIHGLVNGQMRGDSIIGEIASFCGIYSGRIKTNTELDTQIGIVWKQKVIEEIIKGKKKETLYYPHQSLL